MQMRIEARTGEPATAQPAELADTAITERRAEAARCAREFLRCGYWVEIFDEESGELVAGPFDPDGSEPAYIV